MKRRIIQIERLYEFAKYMNDLTLVEAPYTNTSVYFRVVKVNNDPYLYCCWVYDLPLAFPGYWHWEKSWLTLKNFNHKSFCLALEHFFGLSRSQVYHLFTANNQQLKYGGKYLSPYMEATELCLHIMDFIDCCIKWN